MMGAGSFAGLRAGGGLGTVADAVAVSATDVTVRVGSATLLDRVDFTVAFGECVALVGPNGAGKSTLLAALAGGRALTSGTVEVATAPGAPLRDVRHWRPRELARMRAVLTQDNTVAFPFVARQVVEMGRSPWQGLSTPEEDRAVVAAAMAAADVSGLASRVYSSLSGGERARVSLARTLAQATPVILLDEPTAALDIRHQEEVFALARDQSRRGSAVVVVVHDLSLAAAFADRIAVLDRSRLAAVGSPADVLTPQVLEPVYGVGVRVTPHPDTGTPVVLPRRS